MIIVPIISAAVGVLAASSARNMAQTFRISRMDKQPFTFSPPAATADEAVSRMQSMKRKELLELFMACEEPSDVSLIKGEWNGRLLENNGWILTVATRFLTNGLFGRGRAWNGKEFRENGVGTNRFHGNGGTKCQHDFDYAIAPSRLSKDPSVTLRYSKYQFPLSLWYTMMDEVRIVSVESGQVLIGMGSMTWSGGMLNASPFCLWRVDDNALQ